MPEHFEVIVVGAGGIGSAAAYHAAKAGRRTALLEQFDIGHRRGSSHGQSRIIRHSYADADYVSLAPPTFALWRELEADSATDLLTQTGGVDLGPADHPQIVARRKAFAKAGIDYSELQGAAIAAAFPQFTVPNSWVLLQQEGAGILAADRCVATACRRAVAHGARLYQQSRVLDIRPDGSGVAVQIRGSAGEEHLLADRVIVAAGPWAGGWLAQLGCPVDLQVTHQQVVYFAVADTPHFNPGRCPVYIIFGDPGFYGFPIHERAGQIKMAGELAGPPLDPDSPPLPPDTAGVEQARMLVSRYLAGIVPDPLSVETCRYTISANRDFIIDRHPVHPQILFGAGFSGHGFKFAISMGRLLVDLAERPAGDYGSSLWHERFRLR
jgi:monomeric sarcosine oxidase